MALILTKHTTTHLLSAYFTVEMIRGMTMMLIVTKHKTSHYMSAYFTVKMISGDYHDTDSNKV